MEKTAVYLLEFDAVAGPKIIGVVGEDCFSADESLILKSDSFPDTVIQNDQESTIFVFKIGTKYCFAMFVTHPDISAPRGHRQHTFVIASQFPYIYPFTRLLQSSLVLGDIPPGDVLMFIEDFLLKWFSNFPSKAGEIVELPMFDGTLPVSITENHSQLLSFYGGLGWTPLSKVYYLNESYLGFDILNAFSFQSLLLNNRSFDVFRLWESCILGERILVYGATPTSASKCCLSIGSLIFPELPPDSILPFISVTDPRFQQCSQNDLFPNLIVGVSNPIALTKSHDFSLTFTVGFPDDQNGFGDAKLQWQLLKDAKNDHQSDIRKFFYQNTLRMIDSITTALNVIRVRNPYGEFLGQFDADVLEHQIAAKLPLISMKPRCFARKLMRSPFLQRIWKRRCTIGSLTKELENFDISELCQNRIEHELVDLISTVVQVKHLSGGNAPLEAFIDRDIEIIKRFLAPDLILAPVK